VFRQANHCIAKRGRGVLMGGMTTPASIPSRFQCLRTHQADSGVQTRLESIALDELSAGELVVRTRYAGINYKDSLSLLGRAKIVESYPRICGIELVGDVVAVAGVRGTHAVFSRTCPVRRKDRHANTSAAVLVWAKSAAPAPPELAGAHPTRSLARGRLSSPG
jgi:NADPH:quinone reductase-like Zn-dependent oxidoreductase